RPSTPVRLDLRLARSVCFLLEHKASRRPAPAAGSLLPPPYKDVLATDARHRLARWWRWFSSRRTTLRRRRQRLPAALAARIGWSFRSLQNSLRFSPSIDFDARTQPSVSLSYST